MYRSVTIILVTFVFGLKVDAADLPQARAQLAVAQQNLAQTRAERVSLQELLAQEAKNIERLKAARRDHRVFGNPELDRSLKHSQQLSNRVDEVLRRENSAQNALRAKQQSLLGQLDQEISRLRAQLTANSTRADRQALVANIRALRGERDSLVQTVPSPTPVPLMADKPMDDPEELTLRADAFFDSEDKLRREEQALARRIAELENERELEQRVNEFVREDSLFDEQDRRIATTRSAGKGYANAAPASSEPVPTSDSGGCTTCVNGTPPKDTLPGGRLEASPSPTITLPTITSPQTDLSTTPPQPRLPSAAYSGDETLAQLSDRRARLVKLADEMHRKAEETMRQAKSLRP